MAESCVCGHAKSEHQEVILHGKAELVCFAEDTEKLVGGKVLFCDCTHFVPVEEAAVESSAGA